MKKRSVFMYVTGMAANDAATLARVKRSGLGLLAPASGMQALAAMLAATSAATGGTSTFAAALVHWDILLRGKQLPLYFSEVAPEAQPPQPAALQLQASSLPLI